MNADKKIVVGLFLILILSLSIAVSIFQTESSEVHASTPQFLNVSILPSGPVTLQVNQTQLLTAEVANKSFAPFSYVWTDENGTVLSTSSSYLFNCSQVFTTERLYLIVTAKDGQMGYAVVELNDPYATQDIYLDSLLSGGASLEIQYDGVSWWQVINNNGLQLSSNSSLTVVEQSAINDLPNGGLIILRETIWNSSVSIPSNIAVLSYIQGTINYYGSNGIKYNGVALATTSSFPTYPYGNLTGVPILLSANGAQALTSNWNMGSSGTYGVSGLSWVNATNLYITGTGTFGNVVSTEPIGAYSYTIYVDPITGYYDAKAANGTICWSSANATNVINNCTALNGVTVFLTNGLYPAAVVINGNNVVLEGQSWNAIIQTPTSAWAQENGIQNNYATGNWNVTVENLQVDGNAANLIAPLYQRGIDFEYAYGCIVQNCYVHNTVYDGIGFWHGCSNDIIQENTVTNEGTYTAIYVEVGSNDCQILNNYMYNILAVNDIKVTDSNNTIVSGNIINNSFNAICKGIFVGSATSMYNSSNNIIENNILNNCGQDGIELHTAIGTIVTGNSITTESLYGINVLTSSGTIVNNNQISNCSADAVEVDTSNYTQVSGNNINHNLNGIKTESGTVSTTISNNMIEDTWVSPITNDGIYNKGSGTYIYGNSLYNCLFWRIYDATGTGVAIYNNIGYNPIGYISTPIWNTGYIADKNAGLGNSLTFVSGTTYTNVESPKVISYNITAVTAVIFDGQSWSDNGILVVQPSDTFSLTFSNLTYANIKVVGQ